MKEIEIKLRVLDRTAVVHQIADLGWQVRRGRELERNWVYDEPDGTLRTTGRLLRVRDAGGVCLLTLKLPSDEGGPHKVKEELEIVASECGTSRRILEGLGYRLSWRYEKYRTYFERGDAAGEIVLDETPIGDFLELEGEAAWIDHTAAELGFTPGEYITATYGALFEEHKARSSGVGSDMVFLAGEGW
jgi:adenylate cyclase, class 2